ncbi:MAG: hypothetical protein D6820_15200, partial [Lentisphaerae bacterium]
ISYLLISLVFLFISPIVFSDSGETFSLPAIMQNRLGVITHGFIDYRYGRRLQEDPYEPDQTLNELRFQLQMNKDFDLGEIPFTFQSKFDLLYNRLDDDPGDIRLERGLGWFDLRELYLSFSPSDSVDVKAGRQILTWGTGEYIFINDLFPKDWQSFFLGRDDEYLKAPSDAISLSYYLDAWSFNLIYTPRFDPDRFITGQYLSYYNSLLGRLAGNDAVADPDIPNHWLRDDEFAFRAYRTIHGFETAFYAYSGFWKSPGGLDPAAGQPIFPRLNVYGFSTQGTVAGTISYLELGYYDSLDDRNGDDPFTNNSEIRVLLGSRKELARDFSVTLQYYLEWMQQYGAYRRTLPPGSNARDEYRHLITLTLSQLLFRQNLRLFLFTYYSPSDNDAYFKFQASYKWTDNLKIFTGFNIFTGKDDYTFFNQFQNNTNAFFGLRYSF